MSSIDAALARELLDRLAVPGDPSAPLPVEPDDGREPYEAAEALRARLASLDPMARVELVRSALAHRFEEPIDAALSRTMWALGDLHRRLCADLARVLERPEVEVELHVARAHRATAPAAFARFFYVGSFVSRGHLVVADFCYLDQKSELLRRELACAKGRFHAWVGHGDADSTFRLAGQAHELLVAHEDAIARVTAPSKPVGVVANDAGMIGVFDRMKASNARYRDWLRAQASHGLAVEGIADDRGVVVGTEGDGAWDVRAVYDDERAVVVRVALARAANVAAPLTRVVEGAPAPAARAYSPRARFEEGERLEHAKFGPGQVISAVKETIEVAFADGVRKLVHGR